MLVNAGYWHTSQIQELQHQGVDVLVPPDAHRDTGRTPRVGRIGGLYDQIRQRLATPDGRRRYARRQAAIEAIFGHTKHNRRAERFRRQGLDACRAEWRLITATHNLLKAFHATPAVA